MFNVMQKNLRGKKKIKGTCSKLVHTLLYFCVTSQKPAISTGMCRLFKFTVYPIYHRDAQPHTNTSTCTCCIQTCLTPNQCAVQWRVLDAVNLMYLHCFHSLYRRMIGDPWALDKKLNKGLTQLKPFITFHINEQ